MARNRRRRRGTHVGLAVAVTGALQGCAPSPVDPGPGELTGVVVPRGDTFVLGGGGPSDRRYVCMADEIRTDAEDELVTDTAGCAMVERAAPAAVTIELSNGGLALAD